MADLFHELAGTFLMLENKRDNLIDLWNMNYEFFFCHKASLSEHIMFELRVFLALSFINQFSCICIVFRVTPCWTATKTYICMQIYK